MSLGNSLGATAAFVRRRSKDYVMLFYATGQPRGSGHKWNSRTYDRRLLTEQSRQHFQSRRLLQNRSREAEVSGADNPIREMLFYLSCNLLFQATTGAAPKQGFYG